VAVADLEFFQFHPTALHHPRMPRPLLSEALRGHGALLRDTSGERFVDELLPRDVVSRAILASMVERGSEHVWLDATGLEQFDERFPTIHADLIAAGLDPRTDWLPVAPAAHHQCGGIVTDLHGATSLPGLWAAGETSCTGVHGANRLASNSLLEGMVFGPRAVEAIVAGVDGPEPTGAMRAVLPADGPAIDPGDELRIGGVRLELAEPARGVAGAAWRSLPAAELRARLQQQMSVDAGVLRSAASLRRCLDVVHDTLDAVAGREDVASIEVANLAGIARVLVGAALARTESRGTHARTDFPELDPSQAHRLVVQHSSG
jgi:L-aspartate oxidase